MNDLGLDSLDHVEIIVALENEFGRPTAMLVATSNVPNVP